MTRRLLHPAAVLLGSVGLVLVLGACSVSVKAGSDDGFQYDSAKMAEKVEQLGRRQLADYEPGRASCPKDVDVSEGVRFTCTMRVADVEAPFTVTLTKVDQPTAHYKVVLAKALIERKAGEELVRKNLTGAGAATATVTCGDGEHRLIVAAPGSRITCVATAGEQSATLHLRVKDVQGNVVLEQ